MTGSSNRIRFIPERKQCWNYSRKPVLTCELKSPYQIAILSGTIARIAAPGQRLAILIHKSFQFYLVPLDLPDNIETVAAKTVSLNLTAVSAYYLHENLIALDVITEFDGSFISGGDLNAKHPNWNNFHSNHNDKILDKHALDLFHY